MHSANALGNGVSVTFESRVAAHPRFLNLSSCKEGCLFQHIHVYDLVAFETVMQMLVSNV